MAANFLSTCGSERGAPECNTQHSFAEDPQIGHGTAEGGLGVSALIFIEKKCYSTMRRSVQYRTLSTERGQSHSERAGVHLSGNATNRPLAVRRVPQDCPFAGSEADVRSRLPLHFARVLLRLSSD